VHSKVITGNNLGCNYCNTDIEVK